MIISILKAANSQLPELIHGNLHTDKNNVNIIFTQLCDLFWYFIFLIFWYRISTQQERILGIEWFFSFYRLNHSDRGNKNNYKCNPAS